MDRFTSLFAGCARGSVLLILAGVLACAGAGAPGSAPSDPQDPSGPSGPSGRAGGGTDCTNCLRDGEQAQAAGDPARATGFFERGCQRGDAAACDAAARLHARGDGIPEDDARAVTLYVRACELGHGEACADLGRAMANSSTRAEDGRRLLERGCEGGHARSCSLAGVVHQLGRGGPVDLGQARGLYERGCDGGDFQGCGNFAVFLRDGLGGGVDTARSVPLFERACGGGEMNACVSLGAAHFRGDGDLARDAVRARELFEIACQGGESVGCENLTALDKLANAAASEPAPETRWTTRIGSLTIGSGDRTATFEDVQSTCSPLPLSLAFAIAAGEVRDCLEGDASRRVAIATEGGRWVSSTVAPDDAAGRCVLGALGRAPLGDLTCAFEASVSR